MAIIGNNPVYFENESCSLSGDLAIPALVFTWKGYVEGADFREVTQKSIELIQEHKFTKLIGDNTHMKTMGSEEMAWVEDYWIPAALDAGLRFCAVVESANSFSRMTVETVMEKAPPDQLNTRYFTDLESARFWLMSC